jgi:ion channel-forming bestrophin family protein
MSASTCGSSNGRRVVVLLVILVAFVPKATALEAVAARLLTRSIAPSRHQTQIALSKVIEDAVDQPPKQQLPRYRPGSLKAATAEQGRVPYGEESRKYRRTVFTAADWVKHRNSERIVTNLRGLFVSGIVRQLREETFLVSAVSAAVVLLNNSGIALFSLPALPFQLSSSALGLLLVFRTNASYARWTGGRASWARVISNSRNVVRMAATFTDLRQDTVSRKKAIQRLAQAAWLFNRSLMNQLLSNTEDENEYCEEVRMTLDDATLVDRILASRYRTMAAMAELSLALDALPIDEKRRVEIDKSIVILGDCVCTCEKIYSSPVPLVYTRHTARFLSLWMLLLPAAFYEPFTSAKLSGTFLFKGFAVIPAVAIVAIFLFGIEELAVALEEPFSILPLQKFCDGVKESCNILMNWCFESAANRNPSIVSSGQV